MPQHQYGGQRKTFEVHSLILLCESQGLNSGHQAWPQASLPSEPPRQPRVDFKVRWILSFSCFVFQCMKGVTKQCFKNNFEGKKKHI